MNHGLGSNVRSAKKARRRVRKLAYAVRTSVEELERRQLLANPTAVLQPSYTVDEGSAVLLDGSGSSDPDGPIVAYRWDFDYDGGGFTQNETGNPQLFDPLAFDGADGPSSRTIALHIKDDDENTDTTFATLTVTNVAPDITLTGDNTVAEGDDYTLGFSATDPGDDTISEWVVDWGDGSALATFAGNVSSAPHVYVDSTDHTITVAATDEDGSYEVTKEVTVTNVAPSVAITGLPEETVAEGTEIELGSDVTDPGDDDLVYGWSVRKSGELYDLPQGTDTTSPTFSFTPRDEGAYTVRLTVLDGETSTTVNSDPIQVSNATPTGTIQNQPSGSIVEGTSVALTAAPADAGSEDTFSYSWSVTKGGESYDLGGATTTEITLNFVPRDNGSYVATVRITDNSGAFVDVSTAPITVTNAAPTGNITGEPVVPITEGTEVESEAHPTDAGGDDTFTYSWSVKRNGANFGLPQGTDTESDVFTFTPTDEGTYVATCVITDDDNDSVTKHSADIEVTNVNPTGTISGVPSAPIAEGTEVSVTANPADAGAADTFTYQWQVFKNGAEFDLGEEVAMDEQTLVFNPPDNGSWVVRVFISDGDGGSVLVQPDPFTVTNANPTGTITGEPTGSITEGTPVTLTANPADAGTDTFNYSWSVTKGGEAFELPENVVTTATSLTFSPDDEGAWVATCTITDDDSGSVQVTSDSITVTNVVPTVTISGEPPSAVNEGDLVTLTATPDDPGNDDLTFQWAVFPAAGGQSLTLPEGTVTNQATFDFRPPDNGSYLVACAISDSDQGEVAPNTDITDPIVVTNVAPTGEITGVPETSIVEGATVTLTAVPADAGAADTFTYAWSVTKDTNPLDLPQGLVTNAATFDFTPPDEGEYVVTCVITDDDDASVTVETDPIEVDNADPTGIISGAPTGSVAEGTTIELTVTPSDPGTGDEFGYLWSVLRNGQTFTLPAEAPITDPEFSFAPTDEGSYVARVTITDGDGGSVQVSTDPITVTNANPTGTISGAPSGSINEGTAVELSVAASDPGAEDTVSYSWSVTRNTEAFALPQGADTTHAAFAFTPTDEGSYVATVTVTDNDSGSANISTAAITVLNANPTGTVNGEPGSSIAEGTPVTLTAVPADAGATDTFTYAWSVEKDGEEFDLPEGANVTDDELTFTPTDEGTYVATCVVSDNDGGSVSAVSSDIVVTNANPTGTVTFDGDLNGDLFEGDELDFTANPADAGANDTFTYSWTVVQLVEIEGDIEEQTVVAPAAGSDEFTFIPPDNGDYIVRCTITDNDSGSVIVDSDTFTVLNASPIATIGGQPVSSVEEGTEITLSVEATDPGSADTLTYSWSVTKNGLEYELDEEANTTDTEFSFTPGDEGTYVVSIAVTDDDATTAEFHSVDITVTNVAPVGTITGVPTGSISEGTDVSLTAEATDVGASDVLSYSWSVTRDGKAFSLDENIDIHTAGLTFDPTDDGKYAATVTVIDGDDGSINITTDPITVTNANPTATLSGAPTGSIAEGTEISVTANVSDAGAEDSFSYQWTLTKNGEPEELGEEIVTDQATFTAIAADDGEYVLSCTITDDDDGTVTVSTDPFIVTNANPTATITGEPTGDITEGTEVTLTANATDAGAQDTFTYAWSVTLDGEPFELPELTNTSDAQFTFATTDDGDYVATCVITDDDEGSVTVSSDTITATNADPVVTITGAPDGTANEGAAISLGSTVEDPVADTFTYAWSVTRNGDVFDLPQGTVTNSGGFVFTPTDEGEYAVFLTVTDDNGGAATESVNINVVNVNPTATISGAPEGSITEGTEISLTAHALDAGAGDIFTYEWSITKDGVEQDLSEIVTDQETFTAIASDNGTFIVTCTITDGDGGSFSVSTAPLVVTNVNPTGTVSGEPDGSIAEGAAINLSTAASDAGEDDTFTYAWSVKKNGSAYTLLGDVNVTGSSFTFTPGDNGTFVATVRITDKDGGFVDVASDAITVTNVNPDGTVTGEPTNPITEGTNVTLDVEASDAGANDTLSHSWSVTRNGQSFALPLGTNTSDASFSFLPTDNGNYVATCVISDDDGGSASKASSTIIVTNIAPTAAVSTPSIGVRGQATTVNTAVYDVGINDTQTLSYNWGDGSATETFTGSHSETQGHAHIFGEAGNYNVTVTVTDKDGDGVQASTWVTVKGAGVLPDPLDPDKDAAFIGGTGGDDIIRLTIIPETGRIKVTLNGVKIASVDPSGHIVVNPGGGRNTVLVDKAVTTPAVLYGGSSKDLLSGGSGDDIIIGRKGNDSLYGNGGRDILIGGLGTDGLLGGTDEDVLIGGTTVHMENFNALAAIKNEWIRTDMNFNVRIRHLRGQLDGGLNGSQRLNNGWVFEDPAIDYMSAGDGRDWIFANTTSGNGDNLVDVTPNLDVVTNVDQG